MNKVTQAIIISFTVLSLLLLGQTSPAFAVEETIKPELILAPPPTPKPPFYEAEDVRSWTK